MTRRERLRACAAWTRDWPDLPALALGSALAGWAWMARRTGDWPRNDEAACVVCGFFITEQLECPVCLSVCCPGCRERHAPDCSGTPGVGPTPPTEPLADVLARKEATDAAR